MYLLAKVAGFFLSPLTMVLGLWALAVLLGLLGRRRAAAGIGIFAFAALWLLSTPAVAWHLTRVLESKHPVIAMPAIPRSDAIIVLGGALTGAYPPVRPSFNLGPAAGRVWYTGELFRAGKAPLVIVAGGGSSSDANLQVEGAAMADMLTALGVPRDAIRIDGQSRNTRENAEYSLRLAREAGARTVLLVTSAMHMERALRTFVGQSGGFGIRISAAPADILAAEPPRVPEAWFPTASGLSDVTAALKEFAGTVVLAMI